MQSSGLSSVLKVASLLSAVYLLSMLTANSGIYSAKYRVYVVFLSSLFALFSGLFYLCSYHSVAAANISSTKNCYIFHYVASICEDKVHLICCSWGSFHVRFRCGFFFQRPLVDRHKGEIFCKSLLTKNALRDECLHNESSPTSCSSNILKENNGSSLQMNHTIYRQWKHT